VNDYPAAITAVNHVEPVPRRIRAFLAGEKVLDTTRALYVWEWPYYPQYYIPVADVRRDLLIPEGHTQHSRRGTSEAHTLRAGPVQRPGRGPAAHRLAGAGAGRHGPIRLGGAGCLVRGRRAGVRAPPQPLRPGRRPALDPPGARRAGRGSPRRVARTGHGLRNRAAHPVLHRPDGDQLRPPDPSGTVTSCPYKGTTSRYWSVRAGDTVHPDLAWAYDFPTRQLQPIAGLVAFYNERSTCSSAASGSSGPRRTSSRRPTARTPHERGSGTAPLVPALPAPVTALFAVPLNRHRSDLNDLINPSERN